MSNIKSIISLALKPGNEYMREVIARLVIFAAVFFISSILVIIGMVFLVWSSYLYLSTLFNPYVAALISGLIAILLAGVLMLIVSMLTKSSGKKDKIREQSGKANFIDGTEVIEKYPLESGLMAMAAGFIAGSSPESRKVLTELFVTLSQNTQD